MSIQFCSQCGHHEDDHYFRHENDKKISVFEVSTGGKVVYRLDPSGFEVKRVETGCAHPHCGAGRLLHGDIIKHEFVEEKEVSARNIKLRIPAGFSCRICKKSATEHVEFNKDGHHFTVDVEIIDSLETDNVLIEGPHDMQSAMNYHQYQLMKRDEKDEVCD